MTSARREKERPHKNRPRISAAERSEPRLGEPEAKPEIAHGK